MSSITRDFLLLAVKGESYCASAARAVQLIVANALRLAAVNVVGDALLFLGKLGVAACCGVAAFFMSQAEYYNNQEKYPATYLSSGIMPIAVAVLAGYIVAQVGTTKLRLALPKS
jgi:choline transporter-like protein 2/4/5